MQADSHRFLQQGIGIDLDGSCVRMNKGSDIDPHRKIRNEFFTNILIGNYRINLLIQRSKVKSQ